MRGVKGSGKVKDQKPQKFGEHQVQKGKDRKQKVEFVAKRVSKGAPVTERLTVSVGARATIRVGDHEFISPDIMFHNLDPYGDIEAQLKDATRVVDKTWQAILGHISETVDAFKETSKE